MQVKPGAARGRSLFQWKHTLRQAVKLNGWAPVPVRACFPLAQPMPNHLYIKRNDVLFMTSARPRKVVQDFAGPAALDGDRSLEFEHEQH